MFLVRLDRVNCIHTISEPFESNPNGSYSDWKCSQKCNIYHMQTTGWLNQIYKVFQCYFFRLEYTPKRRVIRRWNSIFVNFQNLCDFKIWDH